MEWADTYLPTCPYCREKNAERTPPTTPPCESCRVQLVSENEDAAAVFMVVRHQMVQAGKRIDINIPAVESTMRIRGVKDQWDCLQRVRRAFYHFLDAEDAS